MALGDDPNHAPRYRLARQCDCAVRVHGHAPPLFCHGWLGFLFDLCHISGYILAFFFYMVLMWAILRRTGCLLRKHLLVLGLLPLVAGVILVGLEAWILQHLD